MLGARTFSGNPYDGHILSASLEQATNLTQDLQVQIKEVVVDLAFRGVDEDNPGKLIIHRGKLKSRPCKTPPPRMNTGVSAPFPLEISLKFISN